MAMKTAYAAVLTALALTAGAGRAGAQGTLPITVEARLDAGIPLGGSGDLLKSGLGWGVDAALDLTPMFSIYAGYSRFDLPTKANDNISVKDDGFEVGGRIILGTGVGMLTPYAQVGALFHDGTGIEAGLGAEYPIGNAVSLTPMARFRKVGDLQYVGIGLGGSLRF